MISHHRFRVALASAIFITSLLTGFCDSAFADPFALSVTGMVTSSNVNGVEAGAGTYTLQQLAAAGSALGTVTANGLTGISLWSLLGGDSAGDSDVVISTPAGDNGKNAILRSYVLATSITGAQSIVSLGEIDPFFGGTASVADFVAFSGTDGRPELVFPSTNASGRNILDLASLQVLAAPAVASGPGGVSTSFALAGNVARPGTYTLSDLQAFPNHGNSRRRYVHRCFAMGGVTCQQRKCLKPVRGGNWHGRLRDTVFTCRTGSESRCPK
jgi:hypothetical protein